MKGYTDFATGFLGASFVATKPIGKQKYMDWEKVKQIVKENPGSIVYAGLMEDWSNTSGLIYAKGKYYKGYVFGTSNWATPIVDVDGEEIECYVHENRKTSLQIYLRGGARAKSSMMNGILVRNKTGGMI